MGSILKLLSEIRLYFSIKMRVRALKITMLILVTSIIDLLGIALIIPIITVVISGKSDSNIFMQKINEIFNVSGENERLYILLIIFLLAIVLKVVFIKWSYGVQGQFVYSIFSELVKKRCRKVFSDADLVEKRHINSDEIKSEIYLLPRVFSQQLLISLLNLIAESFILVIVICLLIIYQWQVVLTIIGTIVPMTYIFFRIVRKKIETIDVALKDNLPKVSKMVSIIHFGNIDIRLTNSYNFFNDKFGQLVDREKELLATKFTLSKVPPLVVEMSILVSLIILIFITKIWSDSNEQLIFQISVFGVGAFKLMPSFNRIIHSFINIKANLFSTEILKEDVEVHETNEEIPFKEKLSIKNLSFEFELGKKLFDNITLHINKGEKVGIVGESGTGKSTLLQIILGRIISKEGSMEVDGSVIGKTNLSSWRRNVAFVSQEVFILDESLESNIAFGQDKIDNERVLWAIKHAALEEFVKDLKNGISTNVGEGGALISGGQKQRIAIARALYSGAELILLDEATSSLDEATENMIKKTIQSLPDYITVISITHKKSFLDFCDKVYELKEGKIEAV